MEQPTSSFEKIVQLIPVITEKSLAVQHTLEPLPASLVASLTILLHDYQNLQTELKTDEAQLATLQSQEKDLLEQIDRATQPECRDSLLQSLGVTQSTRQTLSDCYQKKEDRLKRCQLTMMFILEHPAFPTIPIP